MGRFKDLRKAAFAVGFGVSLGIGFGSMVIGACRGFAEALNNTLEEKAAEVEKCDNATKEEKVEPVTSNEI